MRSVPSQCEGITGVETAGLTNHEYAFELDQRVVCLLVGTGRVIGRSKLGYPDGIFLILFDDGHQAWFETECLDPAE